MKDLFELEWMGGAAEHHYRKARPGIEELPWGTLDALKYPPAIVDAARTTWTESAFAEFKAIAAFAEVMRAMCEAKAPLDVIGMASGFVADEVVHAEIASRVAMELGGGAPVRVDFDALVTKPDASLTPFQRANELVLRVSSVAEAFSGKMAVSALRSTTHPLTRAVYERIVADESLHYRLGGVYFDWASEHDQMDDAERSRLGDVALHALTELSSLWARSKNGKRARYSATLDQIHEIGWIETRVYREQVGATVRDAIVAPLARYGIEIAKSHVDALLA